ncbi:MAG: TolC family protein [Blastocatellia bacterium]|nr:TolC family protein [Blastocatellia bacterium]
MKRNVGRINSIKAEVITSRFFVSAVSLILAFPAALMAQGSGSRGAGEQGSRGVIAPLPHSPNPDPRQRTEAYSLPDGSVLAAGQRTTQRIGVDESNPLALTLFDAVKMALGSNREIEVERINVQQAQYDLFAAQGGMDVGLSGSTFYESRSVPTGSVLAGGANGALSTDTLGYDFSAQQALSTGGQWKAQFTNSRVDTNSQFASLNPQYNTSFNLELRQPLMRSLSIDDLRRRIRVANRRLDLSDSQFRQKAIEIVSRVQRSYWDLVFALKDLQIQRDSVDLARTQLERNKRMVNEGTLAPIEIVSVEVELERRQESALIALEAVTRAENALKQLILGDRQSSLWGQAIIPTDTPDTGAVNFSLDEAVATAFANRNEMRQNSLQKEINRVDLKFFENQTRPQVDMVASYGSTGLSGSAVNNVNPFASTTNLLLERVNLLSGAAGLPPIIVNGGAQLPDFLTGGYGQSLSNLFGNDFRTFRVGVSFSFPLRNRTAEAQLGRAMAEDRKIDSQRKSLEQVIDAEVRNALQAVETARQRVEAGQASREAAQKQLDSEERRFQAGMSTTYLVLERQNALSEAQGRELRAMTDYNKAISELQRVMGVTLTYANVQLTSAVNK